MAAFRRELLRVGGDNLVGYWPLDDQGGTTARDIGPNVEDLDITGTTLGQKGPPGLGRSHYFDGVNDYNSAHEYDSEQGTVTYNGNNLDDDAQDFNDWKTTSGNAAYYVAVTDDDSDVSWGYLGDVVDATEINVYTDKALSSAGWNGDGGTGTPASYKVYPSDFNITGALTVGAWVKTPSGIGASSRVIASKYDWAVNQRSWLFYILATTGYVGSVISTDGSAIVVASGSINRADDNWHHVVNVFNPSTSLTVYVDGQQEVRNTTAIPATLFDSYIASVVGVSYSSGARANFMLGNQSHLFLMDKALTAAEVKRLYDIGHRAHGG